MRRQRKPFVVEIKKTRRLFPRPPSKSDVPLEKANLDDVKRVPQRVCTGRATKRRKAIRMVSRSLPHEYFFLDGLRSDGPVIGHIDGKPIPARVIDIRGSRYRFVGVVRRDRRGRLDVSALRKNEWLVVPDLIYAAVA
ncbi:hypothetical protein EV291_10738 [Rhizobium sp. BK068]|nr:hypothetical protein EV291_10738 [Rhizobium sp. BK068]